MNPAMAVNIAQMNSTITNINFCQKPAGSRKTNGAANPHIHSRMITAIHTLKIHSLLVITLRWLTGRFLRVQMWCTVCGRFE